MSSPTLTASSAMPSGTRLGEFEITGVVGEGGFGIVYSARDSSLDRIVAIKEYLPSAFASRNEGGTVHVRSQEHSKTFDAGLASFINEARMLAKFSHPGLVEVFRFWEANGTAYMAMRYYRGVTLREMLRTNPQIVTEQWLCETLDPILLALQELHNEKCYHRDIAPDNILVLPNGRSVLMDFGAARRIIGGMTRALTTVLKPGYAPIEQYSDDGSMAQGAWTDIYAVGGLLYHAMTGKVPVQAISRMMNDPLKPVATAARAEFSPNLSAVVMKCLAVMPENRYQSVDELRAALGWVTTPVSSTVIYQRTVVVVPSAAESKIAVASVAAVAAAPTVFTQPLTQRPETGAAPHSPLDLLTPVTAASTTTTDPLAGLLGGSSSAAPMGAQRSEDRINKPAFTSAGSSGKAPANVPAGNRSMLPIIIIGLVLLLLATVGGYLFLGSGKGESTAKPAVATPAYDAARPTVVQPEPAPAPAPAQVSVTAPATATATAAAAQSGPVTPPAAATPEAARASDPLPGAYANNAVASDASRKTDAATALGKVDLRIKPWGTVIVNGVAKGASPPTMQLQLPPGTYTFEIQNPAGPTVSKTVEVVAGKPTTLRHTF